MRVAFLTRYDESRASSRVRAYQYLPHLARLGVETRILSWRNRPRSLWPDYVARALILAKWADVVVLQKPFQPPWFVNSLARVNQNLVVDFDDAVWEPAESGDGTRASELGRRLIYAARTAGVAIAGSSYLASWLSRQTVARVHVIPSPIEPDLFPLRRHDDTLPIVVGWIGSPENLSDLYACRDALHRLIVKGVVVVRIVSSRPAHIEGLDTEFVPWSASEEPNLVASFDVGIMPLRDTPRTRGRCGFKAIEYMAAGIPVVASNVSGPTEVIDPKITGFLVDNEALWESALLDLAKSPALRTRVGLAGRAAATERFSAKVNVLRLVEVLDEAIKDVPARKRPN